MPITSLEGLSLEKVDYLIIGGGTAGLTLASRLTENKDIKVLVIEAGGHHGPTPLIDVPGLMGQGVADPKYDWTFFSTPQKHAGSRSILQPRGKGLGGSSLLNFLTMTRPSKEEVNALEDLGNIGWNWESFLHYMMKSETTFKSNLSPGDAARFGADPNPQFQGKDGPIAKSLPTVWPNILEKFLSAAEALGSKRNLDADNGRNIGSMTCFASVDPRTAKRSYAASAYLESNLSRKNLLILADSQVTKIVFEDESNPLKRAKGVQITKDGSTHNFMNVRRDIIVSAGTMQTPQILELSGIGNPAILTHLGIKVEVELPGVGENLQDHVGVAVISEVETLEDTMDTLSDPINAEHHQQLYKEQRGLLSFPSTIGYAFLSGPNLGDKEDLASWRYNVQASATKNISNAIPELKVGLEMQYQIQQKLIADETQALAELIMLNGHMPNPYSVPVKGKSFNSIRCTLSRPLSRGSVHIKSKDPLIPPAINPNYFANEVDLDMLVRAVQFSLRLNSTSPLKESVKAQVVPSKDIIERGVEGLKAFIKESCGPVYHPVGTASMLPRQNGGVVDGSLRVYGTTNLRIVDLSVLPLEFSCHTQTVAYAVGEKAADIIKLEFSRM